MFYTCFIMFPLSARLKHLLKECFTWMGAFGRDEPKPTRLLTNFLDFGIRLKRRLPIAARVGMTNGRNVHLEVRDGVKKVTGRPSRIKETQVYSKGYPLFLPVGSPTLPRIGFLSPDRSPSHSLFLFLSLSLSLSLCFCPCTPTPLSNIISAGA
jgi:hypothetical protein